jgi:hypothetical protein
MDYELSLIFCIVRGVSFSDNDITLLLAWSVLPLEANGQEKDLF